MPRHLDPDSHESTLNRGKAIECFLGAGDDYEGEATIRWISLSRQSDAFVVRLYEAVEPRDPEFLDIYAFPFTAEEPDEPIKEERHETLEAALQQVRRWGGDVGKFVNEVWRATSTVNTSRAPANPALQLTRGSVAALPLPPAAECLYRWADSDAESSDRDRESPISRGVRAGRALTVHPRR